MGEKKNNPYVNIIMNCHNGEKFIEKSINSILKQNYTNYEVIFYDNNSNDKSAYIIKSKIKKLIYYKTNITENLGTARKNALEKAKHKYVAFLDCDDCWYPNHLEKAVDFLENNQNYNLTYNNVSLIDDKEKVIKKKIFKYLKPSGNIFKELLSGYFLTIATVVIRNDFIKKNNLNFNEKYNFINDVDLFTRISYLTNIKYLNSISARVRIHNNRLTTKNFFSFYDEHIDYLNDLKLKIKNFENKYENEIAILKNNLNYRQSLLEWKLKKYSDSRKRLIECSKNKSKYIIVFLLTYFIEYEMFRKLFIKNL